MSLGLPAGSSFQQNTASGAESGSVTVGGLNVYGHPETNVPGYRLGGQAVPWLLLVAVAAGGVYIYAKRKG